MEAVERISGKKYDFFAAAAMILVAISRSRENFEIEDGLREDVCTAKAATSIFKVDNVRGWLPRKRV